MSVRKVGVFCNARDETHIKEWAAHHLLIGFDVVFIFDHKSTVPLNRVFSHFDNRVITARIEKAGGNLKTLLMNKALGIARQLALDWFIYLDADEFLILNSRFRGVKHFLSQYSMAGDLVGVNWLIFGTNHLVQEPTEGLMLEHYTRSSNRLNHHIKSFVKPREATVADNPHFYHIKRPARMLNVAFGKLRSPYSFNTTHDAIETVPAYIAHYMYQAEDIYRKRKVLFRVADDGTIRTDIGQEIHARDNDVVNMYPQKYVQTIKEFLSFYDQTRDGDVPASREP